MINNRLGKILLLIFPVCLIFYLGLFLTINLWYPNGLSKSFLFAHFWNFSIIYSVWLLVLFIFTLFDFSVFKNSTALISKIFFAMIANSAVAAIYFYAQPSLMLTPRRFLLVHVLIVTIALFIWYAFIQKIIIKIRRIKVWIYNHDVPVDVLQNLEYGYGGGFWQYAGLYAGDINILNKETILLTPDFAQLSVDQQAELFTLKQNGVVIQTFSYFYEYLHRRVHVSSLTDLWFIDFVDYRNKKIYDHLKRVLDIVIALFGLLFFIVLLPVVSVLIKLTSSGTVFFKQQRVGMYNKPFFLFKFRTMTGGQTNTWTSSNDSRITSVGKWLRKLRIDELPQMLNVLKGDMSLVGPRPEQPHFVEQLSLQIPYYNQRHVIKPGLTGWAQLHVYAASLEESQLKLQYDLYYIKHRSILFDIEILLRTVFHILKFGGR